MGIGKCIQSPSAMRRGVILIPDISGFSGHINFAGLTYRQIVIASLFGDHPAKQ